MTPYLLEIKAFEWSLQIYHIMMKFLYAKNVQQQKYYFFSYFILAIYSRNYNESSEVLISISINS